MPNIAVYPSKYNIGTAEKKIIKYQIPNECCKPYRKGNQSLTAYANPASFGFEILPLTKDPENEKETYESGQRCEEPRRKPN
jgi:hypothetical protein